MLAENDLPVLIRDGRVLPLWITVRDHRWIEKLLDRLRGLDGRCRDELDIVLRERPEFGETQRS